LLRLDDRLEPLQIAVEVLLHVWRCLAGPREWIGTDISFDIQTDGDGNRSALFAHSGWKSAEESFPFIAYSWAQILPRFKKLAEEGRAEPFFDF